MEHAVVTPVSTAVVDGGAGIGIAPPRSRKLDPEIKGPKYKQIREQDKSP